MAEGTVVLPPDGSGKTLRTVTNPGVASGAHQEVVTVALADGTELDPRAIRVLTATDVVSVVHQKPPTSAATTATATTSSGTVLASNTARLGATVFNEGPSILYLHLGGSASLTAYTVQVAALGYYEVPFGFTGILTGITLLTTAVCRVVELT